MTFQSTNLRDVSGRTFPFPDHSNIGAQEENGQPSSWPMLPRVTASFGMSVTARRRSDGGIEQ